MKTLWDESARIEIVRRIGSVTAETKPQWGRMNAAQMLAHLVASARMASGDLSVAPKWTPFKFGFMRRLIIYKLEWPKGSPTAPELLPKETPPVDDARRDLTSMLDALAAKPRNVVWPDHPAFGKVTGEEWGALLHKHFDHHLRQFGV